MKSYWGWTLLILSGTCGPTFLVATAAAAAATEAAALAAVVAAVAEATDNGPSISASSSPSSGQLRREEVRNLALLAGTVRDQLPLLVEALREGREALARGLARLAADRDDADSKFIASQREVLTAACQAGLTNEFRSRFERLEEDVREKERTLQELRCRLDVFESQMASKTTEAPTVETTARQDTVPPTEEQVTEVPLLTTPEVVTPEPTPAAPESTTEEDLHRPTSAPSEDPTTSDEPTISEDPSIAEMTTGEPTDPSLVTAAEATTQPVQTTVVVEETEDPSPTSAGSGEGEGPPTTSMFPKTTTETETEIPHDTTATAMTSTLTAITEDVTELTPTSTTTTTTTTTTEESAPSTVSGIQECTPPFEQAGQDCLYLYDEVMSWQVARGFCQEYGGDLYVLKDKLWYHILGDWRRFVNPEPPLDHLEMERQARGLSSLDFWLGGADEDRNGWATWVTDDTSLQGRGYGISGWCVYMEIMDEGFFNSGATSCTARLRPLCQQH